MATPERTPSQRIGKQALSRDTAGCWDRLFRRVFPRSRSDRKRAARRRAGEIHQQQQ
jgi:hypothetical protein